MTDTEVAPLLGPFRTAFENKAMEQLEACKEIAAEEAGYKNYPPPVFYHFDSPEERERTLYANFLKINQEVKSMIAEIQEFAKK